MGILWTQTGIKLKLKLTLYHMFFDKVLKVKHDLLPWQNWLISPGWKRCFCCGNSWLHLSIGGLRGSRDDFVSGLRKNVNHMTSHKHLCNYMSQQQNYSQLVSVHVNFSNIPFFETPDTSNQTCIFFTQSNNTFAQILSGKRPALCD